MPQIPPAPHRPGHGPFPPFVQRPFPEQAVWYANRPQSCWWWPQLCPPVGNGPINYPPIDLVNNTLEQPVVNGQAAESRWYLGISGAVLPGKGFGIESVEPNSPADQSGLQPGMVITRVNGIDIVDEASFMKAMQAGNGVLEMELLNSIDGQLLEGTVTMQEVATASL